MSQVTAIQQAASDRFAAEFPMLAQRGIDESTWGALCNTIYPGANPDSVIMAVDYCRARKLDIMLKPVHLVPMQVKDARTNEKVWRDVPMPGIGMYRIQADRSGNYAGADEPEFGPMVTQEFQDAYTTGKMVRVTYPEWCKYTVYKFVNGQRVAYIAKEYWIENYATQSSKTDCPNAMWKKRPCGQLSKCTEAQALRKGWPEIGNEPTAEEMEGKTFITDERDITPQPVRIAQPSNATDRIKTAMSQEQTTVAQEDYSHEFSMQCDALDNAEDLSQWNEAYNIAWQWASTKPRNIQDDIKAHAGAAKKRLVEKEQIPV